MSVVAVVRARHQGQTIVERVVLRVAISASFVVRPRTRSAAPNVELAAASATAHVFAGTTLNCGNFCRRGGVKHALHFVVLAPSRRHSPCCRHFCAARVFGHKNNALRAALGTPITNDKNSLCVTGNVCQRRLCSMQQESRRTRLLSASPAVRWQAPLPLRSIS